MSSDLVKRLMTYGDGSPGGILLMREAAARIEALEGENADLKADNVRLNNEKMDALERAIAADARAERLRVALGVAIKVAAEAQREWDAAPHGMKAGKLLIALAGNLRKYRADIDEVHDALKDDKPIHTGEEARLRAALERLGSCEAFVVSGDISPEVAARMDFARKAAAVREQDT